MVSGGSFINGDSQFSFKLRLNIIYKMSYIQRLLCMIQRFLQLFSVACRSVVTRIELSGSRVITQLQKVLGDRKSMKENCRVRLLSVCLSISLRMEALIPYPPPSPPAPSPKKLSDWSNTKNIHIA